MNPATIKLAANLIVTSSVAKVVRDIIQVNTINESTFDQVQIMIGSFAIGGAVSEACWKRTEPQIDKAIQFVQEHREKSTSE